MNSFEIFTSWLWLGLAYLLLSYVAIKLPRIPRGLALTTLNLFVTYKVFFEWSGTSLSTFGIYVLFVVSFLTLIKFFATKTGWLYFLAFLPPLIWLVVFKVGALIPLVGISFMSFRLILLVHELNVDEDLQADPYDVLAFAFFTPTFLIGPISPYSYFKKSIERTEYVGHRSLDAVLRIVVGMLKFTMLANMALQLGIYGLLKDGHQHSEWEFVAASFFNLLYLYFNFSGINDISIGVSNLLKIRVKENFKSPFLSVNFQDFWNRWHISLSELVRDVFFTPVNMFLLRNARFIPYQVSSYIAILVSFIVLGLWHEISLRYFWFGLLHGIGVIVSVQLLLPIQEKAANKDNPLVNFGVEWGSRVLVLSCVAMISSLGVIDPKDYAFIFGRVLGF